MNVKRLLLFFGLAYGISWMIWLPLYLPAFGITTLPVLPYHHALGAIGPLLAGMICTIKESKTSAYRNLLSSMFKIRGRMLCIITATFCPFIILIISIFLSSMINYTPITLKGVGISKEVPQFGVLGFFLYNLISFGYGEETGWRGYALPQLQKRFNPFVASIILTAGWAIWHWPLFFYRPGYVSMDVGGIFGWIMSLFTGSILLTWMYNRSRSILVCAIFHAAIDVVFTSDLSDPNIISILGAIVTIWGIVTLLIFNKDFFRRSMNTKGI